MKAEAWDAPAGLHGHRWRAAEPRAALLLQHGLGEHAGRYVERHARLVPRLVELGFDVHAFDLRGHGRSPGARGVADIGAMVDAHVEARRRIAASGLPVFLFGHSLGGLVTAASVAREPAGAAGLVLSAPALLLDAPAPLRLLARALSRIAPGLGLVAPLPAAGISRVPEEVQAYLSDPLVFRRRLAARLGWSALRVAEEGWRRYGGWRAPVLVAHGTADTFTDPRGSRRFIDAVAAADKRILLVEAGRHELLNDLGAEATLGVVLGWLRERMPVGTG